MACVAAGRAQTAAPAQDTARAAELLSAAEAKLDAGEVNYALTLFERSLEYDSTHVGSWLAYAYALAEGASDLRGALVACSRALAIDTAAAAPYDAAATISEQFGKHAHALALYTQAARRAEDSLHRGFVYANRATVYIAVRDYDAALADLHLAEAFAGPQPGILNNFSVLYGRLGRDDEAVAVMRRLARTHPEMAYGNLALHFTRRDSFALALAYFDSTARYEDLAHPVEGGLYYSNRGDLRRRMGDYAEARADLNRSIALYPANAYVYRTLALVYLAEDMLEEACRALHFAAEREFAERYGDEVDTLRAAHCSEGLAPAEAPGPGPSGG